MPIHPEEQAVESCAETIACQVGCGSWPAVQWPVHLTPTGKCIQLMLMAYAYPIFEMAVRQQHAGERETLEAFLDYYRAVMVNKLRGLSEEDAGKKLVPSGTTLGGLVKHLAEAEHRWFELILHRVPIEAKPDKERLAEFTVLPGETVDGIIASYEAQRERSRSSVAGLNLDDRGVREGEEYSLRWIYLHMIEETARHAGHADILREQIDGSVGDGRLEVWDGVLLP